MKNKYVLPLDTKDAALEVVGGKGRSLARMAASGMPVPGGFYVTTSAYKRYVKENSLQAAIDFEDRNQLLLGNTENLVECINARRENRKPVYTDLPRTDLKLD